MAHNNTVFARLLKLVPRCEFERGQIATTEAGRLGQHDAGALGPVSWPVRSKMLWPEKSETYDEDNDGVRMESVRTQLAVSAPIHPQL